MKTGGFPQKPLEDVRPGLSVWGVAKVVGTLDPRLALVFTGIDRFA